MKLRAIMGKFILDDDRIEKNSGEFFLNDVIFLKDPEKYKDLEVGIQEYNKTFITQSHFRENDGDKSFYVIIFQIEDLGKNENMEDFEIRYSPEKDSEERSLAYDKEFRIFYDKPILEWDKIKKKWDYSNSLDKAIFGSVNAGTFYLNIYKKEDNVVVNKDEPYKVCVLPSSISYKQYRIMIDDIINMKRELIMENKSSKQSIQAKWNYTINDIKKIVDCINGPLRKINQKPKTKLVEIYRYVQVKNIKKITPRTLIDMEIHKCETKHMALTDAASTDIFENQVIYHALSRLKEYLSASGKYYNHIVSSKLNEIQSEEKQILDAYNVKSLDDIERIFNKFYIVENKVEYFNNMLKTLKDESYELNSEEVEEVIVTIIKRTNINFCSITFGDSKIITSISPKMLENEYINNFGYSEKSKYYSLDYCSPNGTKMKYTLVNTDKVVEIKSRRVKIELSSSDIRQHQLLNAVMIKNSNESEIIKIHAKVIKNSYSKNDPLRGKETSNLKKYLDGHAFDYPLKIVDLISINDITLDKYSGNEEDMLKLLFINGKITMKDETLQQINSIRMKYSSALIEESELDKVNKRCKNLEEEIQQLLELNLFEGVKKKKIAWKVTQIFTNDRHYSLVSRNLRNLDKKFEFTTDYNEQDIIVKKVDKLYEYWILFKILDIFIHTGWSFTKGLNAEKLIEEFLKNSKSKKIGILDGLKLDLVHEGKTYSPFTNNEALIRDGTISINRFEMTIYFNETIGLKMPDFAFEVRVYDNRGYNPTVKRFYLDAKYRKYDDQNGINDWYNDINKTAISKYLNHYKMVKTLTNSAFIIHSDVNEKYLYWGGYLSKNMYDRFNKVDINLDINPRHSFGSFYCVPGNTEKLKTYLKMIIEYHFIELNSPFICWNCGCIDTVIKPISIPSSGSTKFHIKCNNCHEFWVRNHCEASGHKLVKHYRDNFHKEEYRNYPWYVKCPQCNFNDDNMNSEIID